MELAEDLSQQFVKDISGVLAAKDLLDKEGGEQQDNAGGTAVDNQHDQVSAADEFTRHMVKSKGGKDHDAECHQGAEHIQKCGPHAVGSVLAGPHEDHGNHLQDGAGGTDNRYALDTQRFAQ